jgi:NAD(P)-dependent dehydrogenase (short-subunit alcohol dehydrogenase family)
MTSIPYDEKLLSKLVGKVVVITGNPFSLMVLSVLGGARGIGASTVEFLFSYGAIVEFADLNDDLGRNLQIKLGEYIPLSRYL